MEDSLSTDNLKEKINLETAKIPWRDLQKFFAAGNAIFVSKNIDLIDAALCIANDNTQQIQDWIENTKLYPVNDKTAQRWHDDDIMLWTVVIKPWVLVQEA